MNPQDSAFPVVAESSSEVRFGLSKREYFAVHLFAGMLADPDVTIQQVAADNAVTAADNLIKALSKSTP